MYASVPVELEQPVQRDAALGDGRGRPRLEATTLLSMTWLCSWVALLV